MADESSRAAKYPLSRWWLRPTATWLVGHISQTSIHPWHVTLVGLLLAVAAGALLLAGGAGSIAAASLILAAWFCDRVDGPLARRLGIASPRGAWLDANIDELVDLGLHAAVAAALAGQVETDWPWMLLAAFLVGKYLFMYGLHVEAEVATEATCRETVATTTVRGTMFTRRLRQVYHAPANADVRIHLLAVAVAANCLTAALAFAAVYYNLRWIARYVLVCRRLSEGQA